MNFKLTYSVPGKKIHTSIYLGKGTFDKITSLISLNKYSSILVIVDENVYRSWSKRIQNILGKDSSYLIIRSGEKNKTLVTVEKIWTTLSKKGYDRKSLVINIGGGMVCDIGAFASSTYMRGIDFIQVPTTLLAMADAAIGGKTGFNYNGLKNTIGTFSAPLVVISDTSFLFTLPSREFTSGLAEILKHAIIADKDLFTFLIKKKLTPLHEKELDKILSLATAIKCKIVNRDPFEKNERKKLNFGHTVGHAIEMACQNSTAPLLHGEAVAIGMIAEARMSFLSGFLPEKRFREIEKIITKTGFPVKVHAKYNNAISKKMLFDKKNVGQQIKWAFLEDIGKVTVDKSLSDKIVNEGLHYILK
jgi:3-dehydroquinate synthase